MKWYEHPTIFYDWVRYGEDLTEEYARWVVQKTLDVHADTLAFCVQVGGYALWDSQVTPKYDRLGEMDLVGELARLCREHDLHFVPWWLGTAAGGVERLLQEHPSWQQVGPPLDGQPGRRYQFVCYNSPYRELLYEEVREVLTNYDLDGIYFDQLPGSCYCPWCQAKFERRYGRTMPVHRGFFFCYNSPAGMPPQLEEFRDESVRSFCAGIRSIIDEVKPGTCYAQNWVKEIQARLVRDIVDVVLPEYYQRTDLIPLGLKHRLTKTYFDHGTIWGNIRHSVRHDARHYPVAGTRMILADCVANLAAPLMLDLCAMDYDASGTVELAETFDHLRAMQDVQAESEPVRYAALLHSLPSHRLHPHRFEEAFEGLYRLLLEFHAPFEVVNEAGIQRGELADYQVLVLPDAVALADETVAEIRRGVEDGLGLVGTYMSGVFDGAGQRRQAPALADLFGYELLDITAYDTPAGVTCDPVLDLPDMDGWLFHYGSARTSYSLAHDLPEDGLFSFLGGYAVCRVADDAEVIADVHTIDQVRLNARPYNRRGTYPGPARYPLAIVRQVGKARLAYFAAQAEAERRRAYAPELDRLLVRSIVWAGGPPPLTAVDCPRTVELCLFHNEDGRACSVFLVNQTTNPLVQMGGDPLAAPVQAGPSDQARGPVRLTGGPAVVRYVTPQKGLQLALDCPASVKSVHSLTGAEVRYKKEDGTLLIDVPVLDLYEGLVVEYD